MTISVVIPTLDEAPRIFDGVVEIVATGASVAPTGLRAASESAGTCDATAVSPVAASERSAAAASAAVEVIVVDGGSRDATCRLARRAGAHVIELGPTSDPAERGRARQLRCGAQEAKGDVLLFLHADTRLDADWRPAVERALADPRCAGGAFTFRFAEAGRFERWVEWWVALRVAILRLPYGDQAIFLRREVLRQMGGVPVVPIMEDLDLVRGIRRAGRLVILPECATTSSRRYRARGRLRTLIGHQVALLGWLLGWDRFRLARRLAR